MPGFEKHHAVLDVWADANVQGYVRRSAGSPSMLLTPYQHALTKEVFRDWLEKRTGKKVGGVVDWRTVSAQEAQELTERMFDAAKVPAEARAEYYQAFHEYIYESSGN
jgi:hypothetical protein